MHDMSGGRGYGDRARNQIDVDPGVDAQTRIVNAIRRILREDETSDDIVVVSHGGVGALLTAHLQKVEIGKESRPQHPGGGCFIVIDRDSFMLTQDWRAIEDGFGD